MKSFCGYIFSTVIVFCFQLQSIHAVEIVRLQLEYGGDGLATNGYAFPKVYRTLDLELYDNEVPDTVANFLNYVDNQLYDLTFVNRSIPGFVIQTGGYNHITNDPENDFIEAGSFAEVPPFPSIINEPVLSNIRGTIAMAKIPDQPDSATNEWFINLKDNSDSLDFENGGFTVFGHVIDDGMDVANEIASFPTVDGSLFLGPAFSNLPVADYDIVGTLPAYQRNLIMIMSARSITRPIARSIPANWDLGEVMVGDNIKTTYSLVNTGNEVLVINSINGNSLSSPFSVSSEDCTASLLDPVSISPDSSCSINLSFSANAFCNYSSSIMIDYKNEVNGDVFSVTYDISADGILGYGDSDADGIPDQHELSGPDHGDGNNDEISDDIQKNVATFFTTYSYTTLVSDDVEGADAFGLVGTTSLNNVKTICTIPSNSPEDSSFNFGVNSFNVDLPDGLQGGAVNVALFLPAGVNPTKYYRYGATPDNRTPHWYDFTYDSSTQTGTRFLGNVLIQSPSGVNVEKNMVILHFIDGARGDDDLIADGIITQDAGGLSFDSQTTTSGSGSALYLWTSVLILILRFYIDGRRSTIQLRIKQGYLKTKP